MSSIPNPPLDDIPFGKDEKTMWLLKKWVKNLSLVLLLKIILF